MSDLEFLYCLLAVFYLWECTCWVRRGGVMFTRGWGRCAILAPLVGNQRGGLGLANPLPPLGVPTIATQFPLSLSSEGILACVTTSVDRDGRTLQNGRFVRWEEIKSIGAKGKSVRVNGELLVPAQSTIHARWLATELRALQKLAPPERERGMIRLIRSAFDAKEFRQRWEALEVHAPVIRGLANALLLFVFVAAPLLVSRYGIAANWLLIVVGLFVLTGAAAFFFRRAHQKLHPEAVDERFSQTLMVLLFSPAAMRATDMLSRPLGERFHPLTVARVLCSDQNFRVIARRMLLDMRYPLPAIAPKGKPELAAMAENTRLQTLAAAESLVRDSGVDPAELTRPPARLDPTCRAFCPRCEAQFTALDLRCTDCGGLAIRPFDADAPA